MRVVSNSRNSAQTKKLEFLWSYPRTFTFKSTFNYQLSIMQAEKSIIFPVVTWSELGHFLRSDCFLILTLLAWIGLTLELPRRLSPKLQVTCVSRGFLYNWHNIIEITILRREIKLHCRTECHQMGPSLLFSTLESMSLFPRLKSASW